ncbi:IclR family transcriptional regulator [Actinomadura graeca]|uniref:IclR family transcriptional regulator n=1 Tax=Actinomadura graeca TaxID=2750812 RepID=A0ABX8QYL9_9ACTN|nr:IclR family transcriptional regulator [Actinomadura graeca]QXJ23870.1 IclR family transcriptional regulator [Actinomadura graeca]
MPAPAPLERTGPVVARALRVLGAFTSDRCSMTLSEMSRCSGLPVSTVHRIAAELAGWGALERDAHGRYHIGLRLWEIGSLAPRGLGLRESALPFLEDLSQVTRENVQLAVREDTELVFVERIAGSRAVPVLTRVGGRFALTATGVGLVLLAHAPDEVLERVLARPITRFTERTMTDARTIRAALADTRIRGYAVSDQQVTMDALSVAAPIRDSRGDVVAAVSLVVHRSGATPHAVAQLLLTSARAISRALPSATPDQ